ncbi:double-strand break repair helicase AddA [Polymorphum gilvum]|uniref:DNA 3'-5' helicase n=1 Tax=Polymorphum gilvum (strain LMG 25793 / CGMCC 1.9160 / SL003B-26A1) TaxID=991905 RepID=F2J6Y0_POLGS|nr:double-strand break repair helicase AddA [Polymorphum gilvum]ADZ72613.1 Double-strand break repair helicase AddA [Polymorphum gilvum SL003B-26A1]
MSASGIPARTLERQDLASRPEASAWVSANAGSGKTFVLSRRVVRLLLDGTDPSRLLCLTFTKAAAAEMATRVFRILGQWVALDDAALAREIEMLDGRRPGADRLKAARRLFAKALETPGGLKIQTIHAFCEALLHQFPLEANVAGHFTVLDDRVGAELMAEERARVLHRAESDPHSPLGAALGSLIRLMPDATVEAALGELIGRRDALRRWIVDAGDLEAALAELAGDLGVAPGETGAAVDARMRDETLIPLDTATSVAEALRRGTKTDCDKADRLVAAGATTDPQAWCETWLGVFLKQDLTAPKSLVTKRIAEEFPDVLDLMLREQARLLALVERRRAAVTLEGTAAILRLADAVIADYEAVKARRGLLDFEDLVVRTANLLSVSEAAQWVQYKLDQGLDHILVDEAQDTSPRQWEVVKALAEEFFAGEGARTRARTIFAVGDEKQSIYSFQGAVPAYFDEMRRYFERRAREAARDFHPVELQLSFRSTPDVLGAVDLVFQQPEVHKGLSQVARAPVHEAIRREPGLVEIWPLELPDKTVEPDDWTAPIDRIGEGNPMLRLARRIAETLRIWIDEGTADAGDVLVLVRKRGAFVEALNRELKRLDIPAAGSDRLVLTDHIAVKDLIALGRFILLPEDDLSLACVLKSPLFGLDDDALLEIARDPVDRLRAGTLWQSLLRKSETETRWLSVRKALETCRSRADFMPPFEFYARLLAADDGRRKFRARLGAEVDDVLDEFLALAMSYEQTGTPGLEGFLAWLEAAPTQIKRELTNAGGLVRIMTVHGSKGLEAPIVILVDPGSAPAVARHDPALLERPRGTDPMVPPALVWLPTKADRTGWHAEAVDAVREAAEEEYRRLLYVAMTRAEDRLLVCGWAPSRGAHEACWHSLVAAALVPQAEEIKDAAGRTVCWRWQKAGAEPPPRVKAEAAPAAEPPARPDWLVRPVPPAPQVPRLQPSRAFEAMEQKEGIEPVAGRTALEAIRQPAGWALERGRLMHRLLETLPDLPAAERAAAAVRFVEAALPQRFAQHRDALLDEAERILAGADFAPLFAARGRAEVAIVGTLTGPDGRQVAVSGQIDRLVEEPGRVLIVDYKTNARPPALLEGVPEEYLAQLAVYRRLVQDIFPGLPVEAALLWTAAPSLMPLPGDLLDAAFSRLWVPQPRA